MKRVIILRNYLSSGPYSGKKGETIDLPENLAKEFISKGWVKLAPVAKA